MSLARGRSKARIGRKFQFYQILTSIFVAEGEGIRQHFKQALSSGSVGTLLTQRLPQDAGILNELLNMQVRLLFLFRGKRSAIYGDRKLQIAVLSFDHLIDFFFAILLGVKLKGPMAMVCGLHLEFICDDLSDKFIRRGWHVLGECRRVSESTRQPKHDKGENAGS